MGSCQLQGKGHTPQGWEVAASGVLYQEGKKGKDTVLTFVGAGMRDFALAMSPPILKP